MYVSLRKEEMKWCMTYNEFIQNIIETRGQFGIPDEEYKERHHIKPRCLGGEDKEENYIDLYAREHFIAHKLLAEENPHEKGLQYAWWCMSVMKSKYTKERYKCTPQEYEDAKIAMAKAMTGRELLEETKQKISKAMTGENNPNWGKHHTEETKRKISESNTGHKVSEETKRKKSKAMIGEKNPIYGKHRSETTKQKISKSHIGKKLSKETRQKLSEIRSISILCVEQNIIYYGSREAERQTGINHSAIIQCCKGKRKTAGGYHWEYAKKE